MLTKLLVLTMVLLCLSLAVLIRMKKIPPISRDYMVAHADEREKLRHNQQEVQFISTIFFLLAAVFTLLFFTVLYPGIKALEMTTYISLALVLIYALYKGIVSEIHKPIN